MSRLLRWLAIVLGAAALVYIAAVVVLTLQQPQGQSQRAQSPVAHAACGLPGDLASAAAANRQGIATLAIAPFGVAETGWQAYQPLIARTIGTGCTVDTPGFADRLRAWQAAHGLAATGAADAATLHGLALEWLLMRPFVTAMRRGCPPSPDPALLVQAHANESFGGKIILARPAALAAYRRMVSAARQDGLGGAPLLTIASAWRGPDEELARCADGSCGSAAKARCSAHRTGLAFDFVLGGGPAADSFSTEPANRLALSQTLAYRWLVTHAAQYGFVNYPFEPWHWEWTGEPI